MNLGLGLDTGGTYTDSVIMDFSTGEVLSKAKSLTTRDDLSIGIKESIEKLDQKLLDDVRMISMSSTLATNSIVEGKGCSVGLIVIGRDFDRSIPVDEYVRISGGHTLSGKEGEPLDEKAAEEFLRSVNGKIDGLAIASYLSVRNPDHEQRVKALAKRILDVPVVCGHELSSNLGFNERTVTCIMNARLIPIIEDLIDSVKQVMGDRGTNAPLMIVKGDGSLMSEKIAMERPIETILSGPAASLIGAKILTGKEDAIVMDMGGTTTDIGILRKGNPRLEEKGAIIGGRRTHVLAAEIATSGLGGDSRIIVNGDRFALTALRVMPLCIAASKWPQLEERLREVAERRSRPTPESMDSKSIVQDVEFFIKLKDLRGMVISEEDRKLLEHIRNEPFSLKEAGDALGIHPFIFNITKMEEAGIVQRIGVTPTDILHAEGSYVEYNRTASIYGVQHQAKKLGMSMEDFIAFAKQEVIDKLASELLKELFFEETGTFDPDTIGKDLMTKAIKGGFGLDYSCKIALNKPIIGIGAPVSAYYPQVAAKFDCELILPKYAEVGNAVGAITGSIVESMDILIRPKPGENAVSDPKCFLFAPFGRMEFETVSEAVKYAEGKASEILMELVISEGAENPKLEIERIDRKYEFGSGYGADALLETHVKVSAVGKPKQFRSIEKTSYYSDLKQAWDV